MLKPSELLERGRLPYNEGAKVIEQYLSLVARCNRTVAFELFLFSLFHVKSSEILYFIRTELLKLAAQIAFSIFV